MRDAHEQSAAIGLGVVDTVENGHALSLRPKIVVVDRSGSAIPFGAWVLEVPHQFSLFGVDADHGIPLPTKAATYFVDVGELRVAEGVPGADLLAIYAEGEM